MKAFKPGWLRELLIKCVLLGCALVVALGLFEIFLRLTGIQPDFFAQLDPQVSAQFIPGKKGWNVYPTGRQWVEINAYGYRDHEWTVDKPPGTVRIAFLGDSYVAAMEVPEEQRISELIEARLNAECGGERTFEVLNFAVTGYGTAQLLDTVKHRVPRFDADAVLAFFYTGNDLYSNSLELDPEPNRVHYRLDAAGELERLPHTVQDNPLKSWLRAHSKTYLFLRNRIKGMAAVHRAMMKLGVMQDDEQDGDRQTVAQAELSGAAERLRQMQHLRVSPPAIERAWALTDALLAALAREVRESADFTLVTIPTKNELLDAAGVLPPEDLPSDDPAEWEFQQPIRRVAATCDLRNLSCLSLVESMTRDPERIRELFFDPGGHWTPYGHQVAADAVYELVRERYCGIDPEGVAQRSPGQA